MHPHSAIFIPFCEIKLKSGELNTSLHNITVIINTFVAQSTIFTFFTTSYLKEWANKLYGGTHYRGKYGNWVGFPICMLILIKPFGQHSFSRHISDYWELKIIQYMGKYLFNSEKFKYT